MANELRSANCLGFWTQAPANSMLSLALNGAAGATWLALGFVPLANKQVNTVRAYMNLQTGTLQAGDISCDIYSDNGNPLASLGTTTTMSAFPGAGNAGWCTFTFASAVTVTSGTQYWAVFKNPNTVSGNSTIQYPTWQYGNAATAPSQIGGTTPSFGWSKKQSTNSGGAWATFVYGSCGYRIGYNDGTYDGFPTQNLAAGTDKIFGNTEVGVKFTSPLNANYNVVGVCMNIGKTGAVGSFYYNIYQVSSLIASTNSIAGANVGAGSYLPAYFSSPVTLLPNTVYRVTASQGAAGTSSIYCTQNLENFMDGDANSLALLPFSQTGQLMKTIWNGSTFSDTNTSIFPFALLLDTNGEFGSAGGGGSYWEA
jgi:hypothetical protein